MQTYIQNHTTQGDMVSLINEYKTLLEKLKGVQVLTGSFDELPWADNGHTALISVANSAEVLRGKDAVVQRRRTDALREIIRPAGLTEERNDKQTELMAHVLTKMVGGMAEALKRLMSPQYGSIWSMTPAPRGDLAGSGGGTLRESGRGI